MTTEYFLIKNSMEMDSMHDSYATDIKIENNCLIIVYDKLNEGVLDPDGNPYYKNKRLTIRYEFNSFCNVNIYCNKNKVLWLDIIDNFTKFNKIINNCLLMSHKYSIDSFNELTLDFSINKIVNGKYLKYKYWGLEIKLDATNVTYIWE